MGLGLDFSGKYGIVQVESEDTMDKRVVCQSGITGCQCRIQERYDSFAEFVQYNAMFAIAKRLGFDTANECWLMNPLIQGSTEPSDLRVVEDKMLPSRQRLLNAAEEAVDYVAAANYSNRERAALCWLRQVWSGNEDETIEEVDTRLEEG